MEGTLGKYKQFVSKTYRVLPINSDPVDADGDNDGIPDKYDLQSLAQNYGWIDLNIETFGETICYDKRFNIVAPLISIDIALTSDNITVYSSPDQKSLKIGSTKDSIKATSIVEKRDSSDKKHKYWLKVKYNGTKFGYIAFDSNVDLKNPWESISCEAEKEDKWMHMFRYDKVAKRIIQNYGYYTDGGVHRGIDLAGPDFGVAYHEKYPVYSATSGEIIAINYFSDFGNTVVIKTKPNKDNIQYEVRYAHLRYKPFVEIGDEVTPYTMLGILGRTGLSLPYPHKNSECTLSGNYSVNDDEKEEFYDGCENQWYCSACSAHLHFQVGPKGNTINPKRFFNKYAFHYASQAVINSGIEGDYIPY